MPSSSFLSGRERKSKEICYIKKCIDWKQYCMTVSAIITGLNKNQMFTPEGDFEKTK